MTRTFDFLTIVLAAAALQLAACGQDGESAAPSGDPYVPEPNARVTRLAIEAIDKIDVLFIVDDSGSMAQEQRALGEQLPRMARALGSGDLDGDGVLEFTPPGDVQLGVVSSDMGRALCSLAAHAA